MTLTADRLLDETNRQILAELQTNARVPFSELGRKVGLSAPAVAERVRRLEDAGIIRGYRADIDPSRIGLTLTAYVRLRVETNRDDAFLSRVTQLTEVLSCDRVTGSDCYILKVAVSNVAHLEQTIGHLKAYGAPTTSLILSSPVPARGVTPAHGE